MKNLRKAVIDVYKANSNLYNNLTGGLWYSKRPQATSNKEKDMYPYGVFFFVTNTPQFTFGEQSEEYPVQFNIYDNGDNADTIETIYGYLISCFDGASLTVSGYSHISMLREWAQLIQLDEGWQYAVQFRIRLQKSRTF